MGIEIEKKFKIKAMPDHLEQYKCREIEQAYLNFSPVVWVSRDVLDGAEKYELTYEGSGMLSHPEFNLPLDQASYDNLLKKHDGLVIRKKRYMIPLSPYMIELDVFLEELQGLVIAEVEFPTVEEEISFVPPEWFGEEVTESGEYSNARLAKKHCKS